MSDPEIQEWEALRGAWGLEDENARHNRAHEALGRKLERHRRAARLSMAVDVIITVGWCVLAGGLLGTSHALPVVVYAGSLAAFALALLAFLSWNRRDALVSFTKTTAEYLRLLEVRQRRRERTPWVLSFFVAGETLFTAAYFGVFAPDRLRLALALLAPILVAFAVAWAWFARRLRRERAALDRLRKEVAGP
jgi:hypothetical protein